jgi:hypothetical protein
MQEEKWKIWPRYALSSEHLLLCEKSEAGKQLHMDHSFLDKSQPGDPPNTWSDILPSISIATNATLNTYHSINAPKTFKFFKL